MCEKKPYYISTAIAYTSAKPHIGNTYEIVLADAIARYKRQAGFAPDVLPAMIVSKLVGGVSAVAVALWLTKKDK